MSQAFLELCFSIPVISLHQINRYKRSLQHNRLGGISSFISPGCTRYFGTSAGVMSRWKRAFLMPGDDFIATSCYYGPFHHCCGCRKDGIIRMNDIAEGGTLFRLLNLTPITPSLAMCEALATYGRVAEHFRLEIFCESVLWFVIRFVSDNIDRISFIFTLFEC